MKKNNRGNQDDRRSDNKGSSNEGRGRSDRSKKSGFDFDRFSGEGKPKKTYPSYGTPKSGKPRFDDKKRGRKPSYDATKPGDRPEPKFGKRYAPDSRKGPGSNPFKKENDIEKKRSFSPNRYSSEGKMEVRTTEERRPYSQDAKGTRKNDNSGQERGEGRRYTDNPKYHNPNFKGKGKELNPRPSSGKREDMGKEDKANFKTVYKGRGKDEKPLFETVRREDSENQKKKTYKSDRFFNKKKGEIDDVEKPEYDLSKFEKNHRKHEDTDEIRLNKYIANSGICSRRDADELIQKGSIKVNGEVITEMGYKVQRQDRITYNGKTINPEKPVYVLLNKPKDFITTTDDPMERRTVMQLVNNACEERIFPVGRLDRNTTGLLLFTNDGELAAKLSHPSGKIKKIYQVTLDKPLTSAHADAILEGLTLEDGLVNVDDLQVLSKDRTILGLEIHVGKNRIVRRIFAHLGYEVTALDRVTYAGLTKKDLTRGKYRFLTEKEVINLKYFK
ncbi:hypothetical protein EL17_12910 [Anditalea andensis]|uniref:Pseudouridine synthase n=2 Tax=Anditalea andensis TaxID=1048983 RepID=A0A074LHI2_9BACT|nr:pseudouridine synthase [Anditalea andensis]KEO73247.1 hypothetical protein EL17_12910 [Anditalea andensis]